MMSVSNEFYLYSTFHVHKINVLRIKILKSYFLKQAKEVKVRSVLERSYFILHKVGWKCAITNEPTPAELINSPVAAPAEQALPTQPTAQWSNHTHLHNAVFKAWWSWVTSDILLMVTLTPAVLS